MKLFKFKVSPFATFIVVALLSVIVPDVFKSKLFKSVELNVTSVTVTASSPRPVIVPAVLAVYAA